MYAASSQSSNYYQYFLFLPFFPVGKCVNSQSSLSIRFTITFFVYIRIPTAAVVSPSCSIANHGARKFFGLVKLGFTPGGGARAGRVRRSGGRAIRCGTWSWRENKWWRSARERQIKKSGDGEKAGGRRESVTSADSHSLGARHWSLGSPSGWVTLESRGIRNQVHPG